MLKQKPSSRLKRQFLLVNGSSDDIEKAILDYIGILGWAKAAPILMKHNEKTIIAANREEIVKIRAALAMSSHRLEVLRASGTLKGLKK